MFNLNIHSWNWKIMNIKKKKISEYKILKYVYI